jgi:hypothetical protein
MTFALSNLVCINNTVTGLENMAGKYGVIDGFVDGSPHYDYHVLVRGERVKVKKSEINKLVKQDTYEIGDKVLYWNTCEFATVEQIDMKHMQYAIRFTDGSFNVVEANKIYKVIENEEESKNMGNEETQYKFSVGDTVKTSTEDKWDGRVGTVIRRDNTVNIINYDVSFGEEESCFDEKELELYDEVFEYTYDSDELTIQEDDKTGKFEAIATELGKFTDMKNKQYGSSVDATYEMMKSLMERYTYDEDNYLMPKELLKHILLQVRMMDKINRIFNNPSGKGDSESPYKDLCGYSLIGVDMVEGE